MQLGLEENFVNLVKNQEIRDNPISHNSQSMTNQVLSEEHAFWNKLGHNIYNLVILVGKVFKVFVFKST